MNEDIFTSLEKEIDVAFEEAEGVVTDFYSSQEGIKTPCEIFHYTNDVGMRSILETGNIWLTDVFSMNDPSEIYYGLSYAIEEIERIAQATNNHYYKLFATRFRNVYTDNLHKVFHMFVASFSNSGEKLDQWRAYADDGRGYALVFDGASSESSFISQNKAHNSTLNIDYSPVNLSKIHDRIINLYMPIIGKINSVKVNPLEASNYLKKISINLSFSLLRSGLVFKHHAYENEAEFRFSQMFAFDKSPSNLKIRYQSHRVIKYVEFDWKSASSLSLRKIIIGPAANRERSIEFVHTCLELFNLPTVQVEFSNIPYRSYK